MVYSKEKGGFDPLIRFLYCASPRSAWFHLRILSENWQQRGLPDSFLLTMPSEVAPAPPNSTTSGGEGNPNKKGRKPFNKNKGGDINNKQSQHDGGPYQGAPVVSPPQSPKGSSLSSPSSSQQLVDPEDLALYKKISSKVSNAFHQSQITITCYIPTNSVGAVIGRRGSTVTQIQKHSQYVSSSASSNNVNSNSIPVRVSIVGHDSTTALSTAAAAAAAASPSTPTNNSAATSNSQGDEDGNNTNNNNAPTAGGGGGGSTTSSVPYTYSDLDWSDPLWTPVVIRAEPIAALAAATRIQELVGGPDNLDDVIADLPLHRNRHATLIGKRGVVLMNVSADTNVRIMVPRRELRHDMIQLEGDLSRVKKCLERVVSIVTNNNDSSSPSDNTGGGNPNSKHGNKDSSVGSKNPKSPRNKESNHHSRDRSDSADTSKNNKNDDGTSSGNSQSFSTSLVVTQIPSQTKLRTIGRKTETNIKKRKLDEERWQLTITGGSEGNVTSAVGILQKWIEDNANGNGGEGGGNANNTSSEGGGRGGGGRGGGGRRGRGGRGGGRNSNKDNSPKKNNKSNNSKSGE